MEVDNKEVYIFISGDDAEIQKLIEFLSDRYEFKSHNVHPSPLALGCTKGYMSLLNSKKEAEEKAES